VDEKQAQSRANANHGLELYERNVPIVTKAMEQALLSYIPHLKMLIFSKTIQMLCLELSKME
jgi:hypothetical protein